MTGVLATRPSPRHAEFGPGPLTGDIRGYWFVYVSNEIYTRNLQNQSHSLCRPSALCNSLKGCPASDVLAHWPTWHGTCCEKQQDLRFYKKMGRGGTNEQGKILLLRGSSQRVSKEDSLNHPNTQELLKYWDGLRRDRTTPCRQDVQPQHIKRLLPNIFMLERFDEDHLVFRLAGTRLCERYGREFRAHNFLSLWRGADRFRMRDFLDQVIKRPSPGLIKCRAETLDRITIDAEMLVLPMMDSQGAITRILGSACSLTNSDLLRHRKLVNQWILDLSFISGDYEFESFDNRTPRPTRMGKPHLKLVVSRPNP